MCWADSTKILERNIDLLLAPCQQRAVVHREQGNLTQIISQKAQVFLRKKQSISWNEGHVESYSQLATILSSKQT